VREEEGGRKRAADDDLLETLTTPFPTYPFSFNGDLNHTPRNAGVVSDGSASQSMNDDLAENLENKQKGCILLLIPEQSYMSQMYALHASKNQTKDKIKFLKMCFLFNNWSMDELVRMAYAMKKREVGKVRIDIHTQRYRGASRGHIV
jgi:hypothetical protein